MSLRIPRFLCGMKQSPSTVLRISRLLRRYAPRKDVFWLFWDNPMVDY